MKRVLVMLAIYGAWPAWAETLDNWRDPASGIELVRIEAGCYAMGTDQPGPSRRPGEEPLPPLADEMPRHEVCVNGFWVGKFEVTRGQWQRIMSPDTEIEHPLRPKLKVSRADAELFLLRLNDQAGDTGGLFRLPTEAEWEYACRAGESAAEIDFSSTASYRLREHAWYLQSATERNPQFRAVGGRSANDWGLHDMLGNAWELVQDDYDDKGYQAHPRMNPKVSGDGSRYLIRGGSLRSEARHVRCGARSYGLAGDRLPTVGLRVVKSIETGS